MKFRRFYPLFCIALSLLLIGLSASPGWSKSRRQPPTSNDKKNKRPGETPKPGEQQDPLPPDLQPTKPQDIDKLAITTQVVNVDAVVYHKKSGQIVTNLKKANFAIFDEGKQVFDRCAPAIVSNPIRVHPVSRILGKVEFLGFRTDEVNDVCQPEENAGFEIQQHIAVRDERNRN